MNFLKKWYIYQKERFPVIIYGLYIFCITFAVFCFCNYLAEDFNDKIVNNITIGVCKIQYIKLIPMFLTAFLQFLMIRIVDEFKDYEEDLKYRPYRPVPRGLIKLKELKILFIICIIFQFLITLFFNPEGIKYLIILWIFFFIFIKDFFIKNFLNKHMLINVFLDEILIIALANYLASYIFLNDLRILILFFILYIISWIVEVARKIRSKEDEEEGVKTYTAVFGVQGAIAILFILETILMALQVVVFGIENWVWIILPYILVNIINLLFVNKRNRKFAKLTEAFANIYIIFITLSMVLLII